MSCSKFCLLLQHVTSFSPCTDIEFRFCWIRGMLITNTCVHAHVCDISVCMSVTRTHKHTQHSHDKRQVMKKGSARGAAHG